MSNPANTKKLATKLGISIPALYATSTSAGHVAFADFGAAAAKVKKLAKQLPHAVISDDGLTFTLHGHVHADLNNAADAHAAQTKRAARIASTVNVLDKLVARGKQYAAVSDKLRQRYNKLSTGLAPHGVATLAWGEAVNPPTPPVPAA